MFKVGNKPCDHRQRNPRPRAEHQLALDGIQWERVYGDTMVYPKAQRHEGVSGTVEWHEIFLKRDDTAPVNVSRCDGSNCGQPSLSGDGTKVVFIRTNL